MNLFLSNQEQKAGPQTQACLPAPGAGSSCNSFQFDVLFLFVFIGCSCNLGFSFPKVISTLYIGLPNGSSHFE